MNDQLLIDDRWTGENGIGRFATEVIKRLQMPWSSLGGTHSHTSPLDVLNPKRLFLSSSQLVYSPGYNAGITRARQLLNIHDLIHLQIASERSFAKTLYYATVVRFAVRRAGVVMTDSDASARAIAAWVRDPTVRIVVVGCGRSDAFVADGDQKVFSRPTFLYVGNLSKPHKNFDVLLRAIALRPDYDLLVVSNDAELGREKVAAAGLTGQVEIRTGVPDTELATLYRGASGSLQPALLEGFGLPPLEAMSCGTRVAHWVGCESVAEIVDGTGISVESATDEKQWADALDGLVALTAGGALVMSAEWSGRYNWDTVAEKVTAVLTGTEISSQSIPA